MIVEESQTEPDVRKSQAIFSNTTEEGALEL